MDSGDHDFHENAAVDRTIRAVVRLMPSLDPFYRSEEKISQYAERITAYSVDARFVRRHELLKGIIAAEIGLLFGDEAAARFVGRHPEGGRGLVLGIVDHHKIIDHPVQLSVPIVSQLHNILAGDRGGDIVTLATSCVPLSEPFSRRSLTFRSQRLNLFPARQQNNLVFAMPPQAIDLVGRAKETGAWKRYAEADRAFIERMGRLLGEVDLGTCRDLSDQFTKINFRLWPLLFGGDVRPVPGFVSLSMEKLAASLLCRAIADDPGSFLARAVLDRALRGRTLRIFEGLVGAWTRDGSRGTQLFWTFDDRAKRVQMVVEGDRLVRVDTRDAVEITPETVIDELSSGRIFPGQILTFLALIFYAGVKPICGWSLEFMARLKAMTLDLLADFADDAAAVASIPLDNMNLLSVIKGRSPSGDVMDRYALDVIAEGGLSRAYLERLDSIPMKKYMLPNLVETLGYALDKYRTPEIDDIDVPRIPARLLSDAVDRLV